MRKMHSHDHDSLPSAGCYVVETCETRAEAAPLEEDLA